MRSLLWILTAVALTTASGCAKNKSLVREDDSPYLNADDATVGQDSDSGNALGLRSVNFPYDSFLLSQESKALLKKNSEILKNVHPGAKIQVEGHCDSRGGVQYNIALGEKRAGSVKKYLESLGVASARMNVISYGKERPLDPSSSEGANARNRRANFVITSK